MKKYNQKGINYIFVKYITGGKKIIQGHKEVNDKIRETETEGEREEGETKRLRERQ